MPDDKQYDIIPFSSLLFVLSFFPITHSHTHLLSFHHTHTHTFTQTYILFNTIHYMQLKND